MKYYIKSGTNLVSPNVVDLGILLNEINSIGPNAKIEINPFTWVILPQQKELDASYQQYTKRNIWGPNGCSACIRNACGNIGIQLIDLYRLNAEELSFKLAYVNSFYKSLNHDFDLNKILNDLLYFKEMLMPYIKLDCLKVA